MKKIIYSLFICMLLAGLNSCEDDTTWDTSKITYFVDLQINGEETVYVELGDEYVDEGATATENGEEVDMETTSDVDVENMGFYTVTYSATNADGYSSSVTRSVIVYDPTCLTGLEGDYNGSVVRNGTNSYSGNPVTLTATDATGIYEISDWIAGYYDVGYDYGSAYAFTGYIAITSDYKVVCVSEEDPWDGGADNMDGTYDPKTGVISYNFDWYSGSYNFVVELTPAEE